VPRPSSSTHPRPARSRVLFPAPALPDDSPVKAQLDRIVASRTFSGALRSQLFLRYILEHALSHSDEQLKEYSIAVDVFERDTSYDPAVNNTVRVEAGRLRSRLLEYYATEGRTDPLLIEVPKGSYRVHIAPRQQPPIPAAIPAATTTAPPSAPPARPLQPARPPGFWAVSVAFLIGAFIGYRASH
jgi:hypothetical protein